MQLEPLPLGARLESYERQASELLEAYKARDGEAIELMDDDAAGFDYLHKNSSTEAARTISDAQAGLARWYHFENWPTLEQWVAEVTRPDSVVAQFESAVEAIVAGDLATLDRLLRENPALVRERSMRGHHATLLIYVGANGVEWYRQKTPRNAVEVAQRLLDAGAEIDVVGAMYRGTTTLGLVATSVHPVTTGVQEPLLQLLLDRGASLERAVAPDYTDGLVVNACLANGRPGAAEFLAARGAPLDLEGAAGVGRLDAVRTYFNDDGTLNAQATESQLKSAFKWACGYGRLDVVQFLLTKEIDVREKHRGETYLHNAAYGGHADIVKVLIDRTAPVNVKDDTHEGTPLGWALYGWAHEPEQPNVPRYYESVAQLKAAGATVEPEWLSDEHVRADARMLAALTA